MLMRCAWLQSAAAKIQEAQSGEAGVRAEAERRGEEAAALRRQVAEMEGTLSVQQDLDVRLQAVSGCRSHLFAGVLCSTLYKVKGLDYMFWCTSVPSHVSHILVHLLSKKRSGSAPPGSYTAAEGALQRWSGCMESPLAVL